MPYDGQLFPYQIVEGLPTTREFADGPEEPGAIGKSCAVFPTTVDIRWPRRRKIVRRGPVLLTRRLSRRLVVISHGGLVLTLFSDAILTSIIEGEATTCGVQGGEREHC